MKKKYLILIALLILGYLCKVSNVSYVSISNVSKYQYVMVNDINYEDSLDNIVNPERGFYSTLGLNMKETGTIPTTSSANLVHLRVNIGSFSKANNGVEDKEISEDALNALDTTLKNIKNKGGSVIIRFAYDGFNGNANMEPSIDMMLKHVEQLGEVISENKSVITYVECGLFGPWGEMHTSTMINDSNVNKVIDKWLDSIPEDIKLGVRQPKYFVNWVGISRDKIDEYKSVLGTKEYRVGLYNDGYLGSESDLGTFVNREKEVKWLESQATHTFYGGEVVANFATGSAINNAKYMEIEGFKTHTTYLNSEWNDSVINGWKTHTFDGNDSLYNGKTDYLYISNHLGYRYVLTSSMIDDMVYEKSNVKIKINVDNVGFANMINSKKTTLVFVRDDEQIEVLTDIDVRDWLSNENSLEEINIKLPDEVVKGTWKVYLRISSEGDLVRDNNYQVVRFANKDIFNEEIGANYIGTINVSELPSYTVNYYLDENKDDKYSKVVNGIVDDIKNDRMNIDNYVFDRVEVLDDEINFYYKSIVEVKNPNTSDKLIISGIIFIFMMLLVFILKKIKVRKYI